MSRQQSFVFFMVRICPPTQLSIHPFLHPTTNLPVNPPIHSLIYPSSQPSIHPFTHPSVIHISAHHSPTQPTNHPPLTHPPIHSLIHPPIDTSHPSIHPLFTHAPHHLPIHLFFSSFKLFFDSLEVTRHWAGDEMKSMQI